MMFILNFVDLYDVSGRNNRINFNCEFDWNTKVKTDEKAGKAAAGAWSVNTVHFLANAALSTQGSAYTSIERRKEPDTADGSLRRKKLAPTLKKTKLFLIISETYKTETLTRKNEKDKKVFKSHHRFRD